MGSGSARLAPRMLRHDSHAHLGEAIDIHGGGRDLIFPHHENERAQSCCAYGGRLCALLAAQRLCRYGRREDVQVARQRPYREGADGASTLAKCCVLRCCLPTIARRSIFQVNCLTEREAHWIRFTAP